MLSAPITTPSPGQLIRSESSVVFVVRTYHDPIARAVDQVRVECRVLRDHVAALHVVGEGLWCAQGKKRRGGDY
jgi:hypothetical protein